MKIPRIHTKLIARNHFRSLLVVGVLASSASAQLPTAPSINPRGNAPTLSQLELNVPLPQAGQLVAEPLTACTAQPVGGSMTSVATRPAGLGQRASTLIGLGRRKKAVQLPEISSQARPIALNNQPALLATPKVTPSVGQSQVVQVQFEGLGDLPEVPESMRRANKSAEHQAAPSHDQNAVTHAFVASTMIDHPNAVAPDANTAPPQLPSMDTNAGNAVQPLAGDTQPTSERPASEGPVITGPVPEVALEVGSLLDADITGVPELAQAVRSDGSSRSSASKGTSFSLKDDSDDETGTDPKAEWHAQELAAQVIATSKVDAEPDPEQSTRSSTVMVHESFATRTKSAPVKPAKDMQLHMSDDSDEAESPSDDKSQLTASVPSLATAPTSIAIRIPDAEPLPAIESAASAPKAPRSVDNPLAMSKPIVQAVKQTAVSIPTDSGMGLQPSIVQTSHMLANGEAGPNYRELAMQLHQVVKQKFPGTRVEIKSSEDGLIVQGVTPTSADATKILSFVRKTALCPVADRVTTLK